VWLDPTLYAKVTDAVAGALVRAGVPGAPARRAAAAFDARLDRLDGELRDGLSDCDSDVIVTTHAAFGYLADRYGLRQEAMTGLSPEGEPDPARLAEIEDFVKAERVTTVFTEPLASTDVADTVARETGAEVAVLDPVESLTDAGRRRGDDYVSIMRRNLAALEEGLRCAA
jgi:zinc transport system substrate-binding protein